MDMAILTFLGSLVKKLAHLNAARKTEVAAYLAGIAETLGKFGPRLRAGAPSDELSGYATETEVLARKFVAATSDVLPKDERDALVEKLRCAFAAKELLSHANTPEREALLVSLGKIAGEFRAAAATLQASAHRIGTRT